MHAPRYGTARTARPTHGDALADVAACLGWPLHPWQRHTADIAREYDPVSGIPAYRTVGLSVARQNGKTVLLCARIALALRTPRATVAYTAQDRITARFKWAEHVEVLTSTPFAEEVRRVVRINGAEALQMRNGAQYVIVTPDERKAGRSMTLDLAVIDEAFAQRSMGLLGALGPTMVARPNAQLWVSSNAGTAESVLWRHLTDAGRAAIAKGERATMAWLEWCASDDDESEDAGAWAAANPSMGLPNGVIPAALADAATVMDADRFRREHLNLWVDTPALIGIDPISWAACRDDRTAVGDLFVISLDISPERTAGALVAVGLVGDCTPVEVIEAGRSLEALVARTAEVATRWHVPVVIDKASPAASTIPALERADVEVRTLNTADFARACGAFYDAVTAGRLAHRGDFRLTDAVTGATKRSVGDAWVWRRRDVGDITPLVAATLARWGVTTMDFAAPSIYVGA